MNDYFNPYNSNLYNNRYAPQMTSYARPPRQEIIKVNGEQGARAFQMAENSTVLLLDEREPIVWLKTTDGAGYATVTAYDITIHKEVPKVDINSLENRIKKLEEMFANESNADNVTGDTDAKRSKSKRNVSADDEYKS